MPGQYRVTNISGGPLAFPLVDSRAPRWVTLAEQSSFMVDAPEQLSSIALEMSRRRMLRVLAPGCLERVTDWVPGEGVGDLTDYPDYVPASGDLAASVASMFGLGSLTRSGSGDLVASLAELAGIGAHGLVGDGALLADAAGVAGIGARGSQGTGSMAAGAAAATGDGARGSQGSGDLIAGAAQVDGAGALPAAISGDGSLSASAAALAGVGTAETAAVPTDITSLATVSSRTNYPGYGPNLAVDGNAGSRWSGNYPVGSDEWFKFDFGTDGVAVITQLKIFRSNYDGGYTPSLQYSDNNVDWVAVVTGALQTAGPANDALVTLTNPLTPRHRYWRVYAPVTITWPLSWNSVQAWGFTTIAVDVAALVGVVATASSQYSGSYAPANALGSTAGQWSTAVLGGASSWWKADFGGTPRTVTSVKIYRGANDRANVLTIEGSNDDSAWTTLFSTTISHSATANDELLSYAFNNTTGYRYYRFSQVATAGGDFSQYNTVKMYEG